MKRILLAFTAVVVYLSSDAQCALKQIPLNLRANASDLIVEGKVVSKNSFWNTAHNMIYTSNTIEVYKIFKGSLSTTSVEILTAGGTVGYDRIVANPSLSLNVGDIGVFTCENVTRYSVPLANRTAFPQYEAYGSVQGFVKYDLVNETASDPFEKYTDIESDVYAKVLSPSMPTWISVTPFDVHANASTNRIGGPQNSIQSVGGFSPTTVTAGTGTTITITGSGFGSTQGSGTVGFKNADDGGATYITPLASQYISWSNTQIVVEVPSNAGTGTIQVTQGVTTTSTQTLTIEYAHLNVDFDPGPGTIAYQTDHVDDNGSGGYTWRMNTNFAASTSASDAFMRAFNSWRCTSGVNWSIGTNTSINDAVSDGTNIICFDNTAPLSAGILGVCYSYWSGCASGPTIVWYVNELDIIFDEGSNISPLTWEYGPSTPSGSEYDFESVAVHELGHGHQLGHVINSGAIMHYALSNGSFNRTLSSTDIDGCEFVQAKSVVANICGPGAMTSYVCATTPVAAFSGSPTSVCAGATVSFTDQSTNTPTSWSWTFTGGTPSSSTSQNPTITYSTPGTYAVSLTATNSAGSDIETISSYITVTANPLASISSQANISCNGLSDGSATVSASSGTPAYMYSWAPSGGTSATASSLSAGTYTCTVTDANGCTTTTSVSITEPTALSASISFQANISCNGLSDGSAMVSANGGTPAYMYSWSPSGGTTATASNLSAGTYTCAVTDANGCTATTSVSITQPTAFSASISSQTNVSCNGLSNGSSTVSASSGTPAYMYSWSPSGGTSATASSLSAGTYTCTVTDANGCTASANVTITEPTALSVTAGNGAAICTGSSTNLSASSTGGTGAVSYAWMPGNLSGASVSVSPSSTTTYTVTGTDSNGCTDTDMQTITVNNCVASTKVKTSQCGQTASSMTTTIYADPVANASVYEFELTDISTGTVVTKQRNYPNNFFQFSLYPELGYDKTYSIRVRAKVGGVWGTFGTSCNVSTPSFPTTKITASQCGQTASSMNTTIYADAVSNASIYEFEFTDISTGTVVTKQRNYPNNFFQFSLYTEFGYGKTYSIRVRANVAGTWGSFGTSCNVSTPSFPTTKIVTSQCGQTASSMTATIYADAVSNASIYEFEFTDISTGMIVTKQRNYPNNFFQFSGYPDLAVTNKTYSIRVRANVAGTWGTFGTSCNVSTPSSARMAYDETSSSPSVTEQEMTMEKDVIADAAVLSFTVYPNPNTGVFNLEFSPAAGMEVELYDGLGRSVIREKLSGSLQSFSMDEQENGIYYLRVTQDNKTLYSTRLVKQN